MARKLAPILDDILTAITGIETAVTNMTFEEFEKNWSSTMQSNVHWK